MDLNSFLTKRFSASLVVSQSGKWYFSSSDSGYVLFQSSDDELPKAVNVNDKQILSYVSGDP